MAAWPTVKSKEKGDTVAPACIPSSSFVKNSQISTHTMLVLEFTLVSKQYAYNVNLGVDY